MGNAGLDETQGGIKIIGRNIYTKKEISITSNMQMIPPIRQRVKRNERDS